MGQEPYRNSIAVHTGGKTVRLRRDRRRLESILASRLEE